MMVPVTPVATAADMQQMRVKIEELQQQLQQQQLWQQKMQVQFDELRQLMICRCAPTNLDDDRCDDDNVWTPARRAKRIEAGTGKPNGTAVSNLWDELHDGECEQTTLQTPEKGKPEEELDRGREPSDLLDVYQVLSNDVDGTAVFPFVQKKKKKKKVKVNIFEEEKIFVEVDNSEEEVTSRPQVTQPDNGDELRTSLDCDNSQESLVTMCGTRATTSQEDDANPTLRLQCGGQEQGRKEGVAQLHRTDGKALQLQPAAMRSKKDDIDVDFHKLNKQIDALEQCLRSQSIPDQGYTRMIQNGIQDLKDQRQKLGPH